MKAASCLKMRTADAKRLAHAMPLLVLITLAGPAARADYHSVTGAIHTLHINTETRLAHVQLQGLPAFNGGGCPSVWTGNSLDDTDFMRHAWPLLVAAKASGTPVTIGVNGCNGAYPKIYGVEYEPRLAGS